MSSSTDVEMTPPEGGGVEGAESSTTGQADTTTGQADTGTGEADTDTSQAEADTGTGEADTDTGTGEANTDTTTGEANTDTGTGEANTDTGTGEADTDTSQAEADTGTSQAEADTDTSQTEADTGTGEANTDTGTGEADTGTGEADTDTGEASPMEEGSDHDDKAELGLGSGDQDDRESNRKSDDNWNTAAKSAAAVVVPLTCVQMSPVAVVVPPLTSTSDYQPTRKKPSPPPFWSSYSQRDTQNYRDGYQAQRKEEGRGTQNAEFYQNERRCQPDDMLIDEIHKEWWGDYRLLEYRHGYIQWLFPIREQGLNYQAQKLNQREIEIIRGDEKALSRILTSYKMMLDFYGMELIPDTEGDVMRGRNWKRGFDNLNHSMHNYLRITRILKCLGEFDYEHLKAPFIRFVLREAIVERTLSRTLDSCKNYWIQVLRSDEERNDMTGYIKKLNQEQKEKRENQKRISDEKIEREKQLKNEKKREREKELNDKKKEENDKKKKEKEENDKKKKEKELNDKKKNEKELNDKKKENDGKKRSNAEPYTLL